MIAHSAPRCFLCPGNPRAGNVKNPQYETTFASDNDFSALLPDIPVESMDEQGLLVARGERGRCRIICHSPRHDLSFPLLSRVEICGVIDAWADEFVEASLHEHIKYVLIFESRGEVMGVASAHPHSQVWLNESIPTVPALETAKQKEYSQRTRSCLLCDYVKLELQMQSRVIVTNDNFAAVSPFWAAWPYEALVVPLHHFADIQAMPKKVRQDLADILNRVTVRFDNLFSAPFPYFMGIHQRPCHHRDAGEWHCHVHFLPPLTRTASLRKQMTGYEAFGMAQRDFTPEEAARRLRNCSDTRYTKDNSL